MSDTLDSVLDLPTLLPKLKSGTVDVISLLNDLDSQGLIELGDTLHTKDNNWVLLKCPLHDDKRPSFEINIKSGAWVCFSGCGRGSMSSLLKALDPAQYTVSGINCLYAKHALSPSEDDLLQRISDFAGVLPKNKDIFRKHLKLSLWAYYNRDRDAEGVDTTLRIFDSFVRLDRIDMADALVTATLKGEKSNEYGRADKG